MSWLPDLSSRQLGSELMDDPDLQRDSHFAALDGLSRLNRLSRSASIVWRPIRQLALDHPQRSLRLLDIATGSGDIPIQLAQRAARANIPLEITAVDISGRALQHARRRAERAGQGIGFRKHDVLQNNLDAEFDVVICSLFLHHLQEDQAQKLLETMATAATQLVLVNDLSRCKLGYMLAYTAGRLFTRSQVVHTDGPLSVKAAFTMDEVREMADRAGLHNARVAPRWPCRYLLQWHKNNR